MPSTRPPAASVGPSIPSVPTLRNAAGSRSAVERGGHRERQLLVAPALAAADDADRRLAGADHAHGTRQPPRDFERAGHERRPGVARLADDRRLDRDRREAAIDRRVARGVHRVGAAADQVPRRPRQPRIPGLRRLRHVAARAGLEALPDGLRQTREHAAPRDDGQRVLPRRRIGRGRPRSDDAGIVAHGPDDVGERERDDLAARRRGEAAALHRRQVLADGVQLVDRRAGLEQQLRRRLLVGQRDAVGRRRQQRRRAARQQDEQRFVGRGVAREVERGAARRLAGLGRDGMAGPHRRDRRGPLARPMGRDDQPALHHHAGVERGAHHRAGRLPRRDDADAAAARPRREPRLERGTEPASGLDGLDAGGGDRARLGAQTHQHLGLPGDAVHDARMDDDGSISGGSSDRTRRTGSSPDRACRSRQLTMRSQSQLSHSSPRCSSVWQMAWST